MREAAIVLSCLGETKFTPVVPIEPPPITDQEYFQLYQVYESNRQKLLELTSTDLAWRETNDSERVSQARRLRAESDRLEYLIAPFRSWVRHNELLSTILTQAGFDRFVFLFEPGPGDFRTIYPGFDEDFRRFLQEVNGRDPGPEKEPFSDLHGGKIFFLESGPANSRTGQEGERRLYHRGLSELLTNAWSEFRPESTLPAETVDVPFDTIEAWPPALFLALHKRLPLRCTAEPSTGLRKFVDEMGDIFSEDEAVLVENVPDAGTLLGIIYAHHRGAKLILVPEPNLDLISSAIASYQARIEGSAKILAQRPEEEITADQVARALGTKSTPEGALLRNREGLLQSLRVFLTGSSPITDIESAVSAQIPSAVGADVGARRLTAFTKGVPYSFLRTATADWSQKPIGHVAGDWPLIVLSEIFSEGLELPEIELGAIFDPGFFRTSETRDVLEMLRRHVACPLVLSEEAASFSTLRHLSSKQLTFIFFNTHGSNDSIILGDGPLPNHLLAQWLRLGNLPIVFNNSCLSWTGVGKEFVRTGARGYIGTLWSIPAKTAADFARIVAKSIFVDQQRISQAIRGTHVGPGTERAYIYVGTANARLPEHAAISEPESADVYGIAAEFMLEAAETAGPELALLLYQEARRFLRLAISDRQAATIEFVDLALRELALIVQTPALVYDDHGRKGELFRQCAEALRLLDVAPEIKNPRWARFYQLQGNDFELHGQPQQALRSYQLSIDSNDSNQGDVHVSMAQILAEEGSLAEAKSVALQAKELSEQQNRAFDRMHALGILVQVCRRLGELKEGLDYADLGYNIAQRMLQYHRQALFRQDQANICLGLRDHDQAVRYAEDSLKFYRIAQSKDAELFAYEQLYRCWFAKGDLEKAEYYARAGLEQSGINPEHGLTPAFLRALGDIAHRRGTHRLAIDQYAAAATGYSSLGRLDMAAAISETQSEIASKLSDSVLLWEVIVRQLDLVNRAGEKVQGKLIQWIYASLKRAMAMGSVNEMRKGLDAAWAVVEIYQTKAGAGGLPPYGLFAKDMVIAFGQGVLGHFEIAIELAKTLDARSESALQIEHYFSSLHSRAAHGAVHRNTLQSFWKRLKR